MDSHTLSLLPGWAHDESKTPAVGRG